jgi:Gluconate 2-dehydrogenase subunit 3
VPIWLTDAEYRTLVAACDRIVPAGSAGPGAVAGGAPEYIDGLLGAFLFDPPRIWAGGPTSGRHGGEEGFGHFHRLSPLDELAWRMRIEGSQGLPEREFNGPVEGLQQRYRDGLAALGENYCERSPLEQEEALRAVPEFATMLFHHVCEGMYGDPEYGGNPDGIVWEAIGYAGDTQPRGWTDLEVSDP